MDEIAGFRCRKSTYDAEIANVVWKSGLPMISGAFRTVCRQFHHSQASSARMQLTQMDLIMSNLVQNCGGKSASLISKNPRISLSDTRGFG